MGCNQNKHIIIYHISYIYMIYVIDNQCLLPPIHLLRRDVLNNAAFIREPVVNSMVKLLQNFSRYKYNCLIYSHILNPAGLRELSVN